MLNIENRHKRLFGDVSLCALSAIGLIALGLSPSYSGFPRACLTIAALLGFAPLVRAFVLRLMGSIRKPPSVGLKIQLHRAINAAGR